MFGPNAVERAMRSDILSLIDDSPPEDRVYGKEKLGVIIAAEDQKRKVLTAAGDFSSYTTFEEGCSLLLEIGFVMCAEYAITEESEEEDEEGAVLRVYFNSEHGILLSITNYFDSINELKFFTFRSLTQEEELESENLYDVCFNSYNDDGKFTVEFDGTVGVLRAIENTISIGISAEWECLNQAYWTLLTDSEHSLPSVEMQALLNKRFESLPVAVVTQLGIVLN